MKFDDAVNEIEAEYARLGHTMSWRFLCVSKAIFAASPRIALFTANPGGGGESTNQGKESCENGCAYYVESWAAPPGKSTLQLQVQALFDMIASHIGYDGSNFELMDDSLIAYFIPFRSPSIEELPQREASTKFAQRLWRKLDVLQSLRLVITIDPVAFRFLGSVLGCAESSETHHRYETGWGNVSAEMKVLPGPEGDKVLIRLPHLSRFQLFSRDQSRPYLDRIFRDACKKL